MKNPALPHMPDGLTLVMYHYVRPVPDRHGFAVQGLLPAEFEHQLDYIGRNYSVCSLADVVSAARGEARLPPRPCVLTFDDGVAEHAQIVWPALRRRGWKGAFFASASATLDRTLLSVHKIHLLLAAGLDPERLSTLLVEGILERSGRPDVPTPDALWREYGVPGRYDDAPVHFFKRVLQKALPEDVRTAILDDLFRTFISADESELADDFYVSLDDLQAMVDDGQVIGGHGIRHEWMDRISEEDQVSEIHGTLDLLARVHDGQLPDPWFFAYPYGAYNQRTIELLQGARCAAAVTVRIDLAGSGTPLLELPRIDTNDLPRVAGAPSAPWTQRVSGRGFRKRLEPAPADL